ncbi:MAG: hypothetical protein LBI28_09220 [Treponema sp.]|nr:hypothetical protein [Treponema sp.]
MKESKPGKEPWESGSEKAKTLKIEDFGTHEEVLDGKIGDRLEANKKPSKETTSEQTAFEKPSYIGHIKEKFVLLAVLMEEYEFTKENYDKLFPNGKVKTPLGYVKLGEHQFEKLKTKERMELLGALKQTLADPIIVFSSGVAEIYTKSFIEDEKTKAVLSVVITKEGEKISISTHRRDLSNVLNKIKKDNILYEKDIVQKDDRVHTSWK